MALSKVFVDPERFKKNEAHKDCCLRTFPPSDIGNVAAEEYAKDFLSREDSQNLCSCSTLDLIM